MLKSQVMQSLFTNTDGLSDSYKSWLEKLNLKEPDKEKKIFDLRPTPFSFVSYLIKIHKDNNLTPQWKFSVYLRGAKKMIDIFGKQNSVFLFQMFAKHAIIKHPFSFLYVIRWCKEQKFTEYIAETKMTKKSLF